MAIFFTLLYLFTAYLAPETLFGSLSEYHIEIFIAIVALLIAAFLSRDSQLFKAPQTYALLAFIIAIALSILSQGLFGLTLDAVRDFVPNAFTFFLIVLACKKRLHLQLLAFTLFLACAYTIFKGDQAVRADDVLSPYLLLQTDGGVMRVLRIRGLSFINDPNDFGQLLVSLIPCLFFSWRSKSFFRNLLLVYLPAGVLFYGMFLTHSRGVILAFLAIVVVAARPRLGNIRSALIAGVLFLGTSAIGWSGSAGRDISSEGGADRIEAWAAGLELIKTHPIFGVGYKRFTEHYYITAHNSIVVCAAEVGFFGFFFWVMLILVSIRDTSLLGNKPKTPAVRDPDEELPDSIAPYNSPPNAFSTKSRQLEATAPVPLSANAAEYNNLDFQQEIEDLPEKEVRRLAKIVNLALVGFLTAGYFLSRAYIMTLYVYVGLAVVVYKMGLDRGFAPPRMQIKFVLRYTLIASVSLIILVYVILRIQHLTPH